MNIEEYIRDIADFPRPGVIFKDITPLLNDFHAVQAALDQLVDLVGDQKIDRVVGMESRGFFFGTLLAQRLHAGFIPVRKPKKLPFKTLAQEYALEYGSDILEIHCDAIKKGERILIHDDVLATGGTAEAVCKLVEQLGGEIVQFNFLMELSFLNGRDKLKPHAVASVLKY